MTIKKITLKELIFLGILSAVLLLASALIIPLVMFTQIMALRQLLAAPVFAIFVTIGLRKVTKPGALLIIGLITGLALMPMSVIMTANNIVGAIIVELLVLLIFKGYQSRKSIIFAATIYMPVTLPISLFTTMIMKGRTMAEMMGSSFDMIVLPIGSVVLGLVGALLGMKIADELTKAGRLK